jgi:hypothetical protein
MYNPSANDNKVPSYTVKLSNSHFISWDYPFKVNFAIVGSFSVRKEFELSVLDYWGHKKVNNFIK